MRGPWRWLVLAAAFTGAADAAVAQTVMVRNAPQGSTVELVLNAATVGTAPAKPGGETTLTVPPTPGSTKTEMDVRIWVDLCGTTVRRVLLIEAGLYPAPKEPSCDRREIPGVFLARQVTTFVVDMAGTSPSVWLRQGPVPAAWLGQGPTVGPEGPGLKPRTGLTLAGAGGLGTISDIKSIECGTVTDCTGKRSRLTYSVGATVWIFKFLGLDFGYTKPTTMTLNGSNTGFRFTTNVDARLYTIAAKIAVPAGPVRIYVLGGTDYHQATISTSETIDDRTVTVDGVDQVIKGGTQTFELKTAGWGVLAGGGIEVWVAPAFALYTEAGRAWLKGPSKNGADGRMDDRLGYIFVGGRFHIGR